MAVWRGDACDEASTARYVLGSFKSGANDQKELSTRVCGGTNFTSLVRTGGTGYLDSSPGSSSMRILRFVVDFRLPFPPISSIFFCRTLLPCLRAFGISMGTENARVVLNAFDGLLTSDGSSSSSSSRCNFLRTYCTLLSTSGSSSRRKIASESISLILLPIDANFKFLRFPFRRSGFFPDMFSFTVVLASSSLIFRSKTSESESESSTSSSFFSGSLSLWADSLTANGRLFPSLEGVR
mmetsp:Transcript_1505/g.2174  ORF Transcript_1505/g.2174 Transcript_1505/m.2174 type:complete len:239 (+) Transcript_1505:417-1133(+)